MKEKIKYYLNEINEVKKIIHPSILAASLVYYSLIVIIPFFNILLFTLCKLGLLSFDFELNTKISIISIFFFIINIFYVSSKIIHALKKIMQSIYQISVNNEFIERIKSILLLVSMFLLLISDICLELYITYIFDKFNFNDYLKSFIIVIERIAFILFFLSILFKKIIPISISLKNTFKISFVFTIITAIVIEIYNIIINMFTSKSFYKLYGDLYQVFIILTFLYIIFSIFIYCIIIEYIMYKKNKIVYNNNEHERGA